MVTLCLSKLGTPGAARQPPEQFFIVDSDLISERCKGHCRMSQFFEIAELAIRELRFKDGTATEVQSRTENYPFTLIFENDSTARPEVGTPIDIAGRNVENTSIRFTSGRIAFEVSGPARMR
jgi:hypothetical protein